MIIRQIVSGVIERAVIEAVLKGVVDVDIVKYNDL